MHDDPHDRDPADHRRLGRQLELFASHELAGAGLPLWLPDGAVIRAELERFIIELEREAGYQRVFSPVLAKRELYERSGHWQHFKDDMFPPMDVGGDQLVLRPSNCPHHILIYKAGQHSFRDLPVRLCELGAMFRFERSGVLGGLSRVRAMTLNDAHVFVSVEQLADEVAAMLGMIDRAYKVLGIDSHHRRLSLHGSQGSYVDDPPMWRRAETALAAVLDDADAPWVSAPDEAAFYGPKIDVQVADAQGRELTLSTVQVDFHLPVAFDVAFRNSAGDRERPVLIHRSVISTMERMTAFLIEHYAGRFPVWLAPVQLAILPVDAAHQNAASAVRCAAAARGLRVDVLEARQSLGARVRHVQQRRVPFMAVLGDREVAAGTVSVRRRDGQRVPAVRTGDLVEQIARLSATRSLSLDVI